MNQELEAKSRTWRNMGIGATVVAVVAAAFAAFSFHKAAVYHEQAMEVSRPGDGVDAQVKTAPKGAVSGHEAGQWLVQVVRDGKVISEEVAQNFLADEGEADLLACFYQSATASTGNPGCPTGGFTGGLLSTTATPAENSTWASLSATELVTGTSAGYASWTIARANTGWFGTSSGTAPTTVASGTGGCTETSCAQVSTAQTTITASGNWTVGARYIVIRGTTGNRLISVAQLSADRTLQSGDQLNLTYRQAMQ
jgi:hypothetical protein